VTSTPRHSEAAFEAVIEHHLLGHGYVAISRDGFDRERAIFPSVILDFIRARRLAPATRGDTRGSR
jgi:type I restriction enzyme, R subunit